MKRVEVSQKIRDLGKQIDEEFWHLLNIISKIGAFNLLEILLKSQDEKSRTGNSQIKKDLEQLQDVLIGAEMNVAINQYINFLKTYRIEVQKNSEKVNISRLPLIYGLSQNLTIQHVIIERLEELSYAINNPNIEVGGNPNFIEIVNLIRIYLDVLQVQYTEYPQDVR